MRPIRTAYTLALAVLLLAGCQSAGRYSDKPLVYPQTRMGDVVDDYHGTQVADPYRWLEDPDSPETRAWIEAENKLSFGYLEEIPARKKIEKRITELFDYEKYGAPFREGGRYFYSKNDGLQNQSVIYTLRSLDDEPKVLIDPNKLSEDGTVALSGLAISKDGKLMAYGVSSGGSDWQEWKVRDIETGQDLDDHLEWIKFSGASWTHDHKGFFYSRYDEPAEGAELQSVNEYQKVYYHLLGTPQSQDVLVYERPDHKDWNFSAGVTDDGRYLIIDASKGTERKNAVFYKDLQDPGAKVVELLNEFDAEYGFIDNDGPLFWFRTDYDAPRSRVVAIDITKPDKSNWQEVIPEADETLRGLNMLDNKFVASYLKDAHTQVKIFDRDGKFIREVKFPGLGTAGGFGGKRHEKETFYHLHQLQRARHHLSLRYGHGQERDLPPAQGRFRP